MTTPNWLDKLQRDYTQGIAHAFILHGPGVQDYVEGNYMLEQYLVGTFVTRVMVHWDLARGFRFPSPAAKRSFLQRTGLLVEPQEAAPVSGVLAALQRTGAVPAASGADDVPLPESPADCLRLLETFLMAPPKDGKAAAVVLSHIESIATDAPLAQKSMGERELAIRLQEWGRNSLMAANGSVVIAITTDLFGMDSGVRAATARWSTIELGIPNEHQRLEFWQLLASAHSFEIENGVSLEMLARLTAGLGRLHIEDVVMQAKGNRQPVTVELVQARKAEIIASEFGEVIELRDPRLTLDDIAGKAEVKAAFQANVIRPLREGNERRTWKGALLMGPAGTGKTVLAEAIAGSAGVNFAILNLSKILGKYVGESEKNLEKALRMVSMMAPTVVFVDEAESVFPRRDSATSNDGGVSNRVMTRVMQFMSDTSMRGKVVWLFATNYPKKMDDAFVRSGRIDAKIPVLLPDTEERIALIQIGLRGVKSALNPADLVDAAAMTEGYTGAEIADSIIVKAISVAQDSAEDWRSACVTREHLMAGVARTRRTTRGIPEMTADAIANTDDLDLLPASYLAALEAQDAPQEAEPEVQPAFRQGGRSLL
jgi:transitional endoplasmic reticulum ATPase